MTTFDLDKRRAAARREAKHAPITFKLNGKTFSIPAELPFGVVEAIAEVNTNGATDAASPATARAVLRVVRAMLGEQYDEFVAAGPSAAEANDVIAWAMDQWGTTPGESPASES